MTCGFKNVKTRVLETDMNRLPHHQNSLVVILQVRCSFILLVLSVKHVCFGVAAWCESLVPEYVQRFVKLIELVRVKK